MVGLITGKRYWGYWVLGIGKFEGLDIDYRWRLQMAQIGKWDVGTFRV